MNENLSEIKKDKNFWLCGEEKNLKCVLNRRSSCQISLDGNYMKVKVEFQLCSTVFKLVANDAHKVFSQPKEQTQEYSSKRHPMSKMSTSW